MPTVQRHVQVTGDKVKTISAADLDRIIPDKALDRSKQSYLTQVGSCWLGTTRSIAFPVSFADTPSVVLSPLGSTDMTALAGVEGSAYVYGIHDAVSGSFQAFATPSQYFALLKGQRERKAKGTSEEEILKAILAELRDLKKGSILGDLPQRKGWIYRPFGYSNIPVAVGEEKQIFSLDKKGWLLWGAISSNNPNIAFTLELSTKDGKYAGKTDTTTPYVAGLTVPNGAWWVSKYDAVNSIYTITFSPYFPWPFNQTCKLSVENKTSSAGTVSRVSLIVIELK
jgi:hypothetical protein